MPKQICELNLTRKEKKVASRLWNAIKDATAEIGMKTKTQIVSDNVIVTIVDPATKEEIFDITFSGRAQTGDQERPGTASVS